MEEFLARKYPVNRRKKLNRFFTVLVNGVGSFSQNGMERNDKKVR